MKRKNPATIEAFFNAAKDKKPVSIDEVVSLPRRQLSFVKSQPQKGVIHIQIPSLSEDSASNDDKIDDIVRALKQGIHSLFDEKFDEISFHKLFSNVEYVCRTKSVEFLYKSILDDLQEISTNFIKNIPQEFNIDLISQNISSFEKSLDYFIRIFLYLDRSYVYPHRIDGFTSLSDIVYSCVRNGMSKELADLIADQILIAIEQFRLHKETKLPQLKIGLNFVKSAKIYNDHLEPTLFLQTKDYYEDISSNLNLHDLINWYSDSCDIESELLKCGLENNTYKSIQSMQTEIVLKQAGQRVLYSDDFAKLIDAFEIEPLQKIASTFSDPEMRKLLLDSISSYFSNSIKTKLTSPESELIKEILSIVQKMNDMVHFIFDGQREAHKILFDKAGNAISAKRDLIAKNLAKYIDSGSSLNGAALDLFKLIDASEIFEATYFHLFGRRILSWNIDVQRELDLIDTLQKSANKEYTDRLLKTVNDYSSSQRIIQPEDKSISYRCLCLYERDWSTDEGEIHFPQEIQLLNEQYKQRYLKHQKSDSHINLHFSASLSSATLKYKDCVLNVSGEQCLILLSLSGSEKSANQIHDETGINENIVNMNLQILSKKPHCLVIKNGEMYSINSDAQISDEVSYPSSRSSAVQLQRASADNDINVIRTNMMHSMIIKVIKEFRSLKIEDLLSKVKKKLNFVPELDKLMHAVNELKTKELIYETDNHVIKFNP